MLDNVIVKQLSILKCVFGGQSVHNRPTWLDK
jgi:hypothetical protein